MYHLNRSGNQRSIKQHLPVVYKCHLSMNWDSSPDVLLISCISYFERNKSMVMA